MASSPQQLKIDEQNLTQELSQTSIFQQNKISSYILVFIGFVLFIYFLGLYKLLTTKKYKNLYDSDTSKYIILSNILLSYIYVFIFGFYLFKFKNKIIDKIKKEKMLKYILVILGFIYIIYILSILRFTYILKNIDDYAEYDYCFLTNYYILMQIIPFILFFIYIYYNTTIQHIVTD